MFCSAPALPEFDRGIIRYMRLKGYKKFAIISSNDGSGQANDAATRAIFALPESRDLKVVTWEHINPATSTRPRRRRTSRTRAPTRSSLGSRANVRDVLRNLRDAGVDLPLTPNGANVDPDELTQFNDFLPKDMPLAGVSIHGPAGSAANAAARPGKRL